MGSPRLRGDDPIPHASLQFIEAGQAIERPAADARRLATLRAWLLALLRFAVTLQDGDRMMALAAAAELDRTGDSPAAFRFFSRASVSVCMAIAAPEQSASAAVLQQHLARIDDPRLQRAFAAALDIKIDKKRAAKPAKVVDLWKGLRGQRAPEKKSLRSC